MKFPKEKLDTVMKTYEGKKAIQGNLVLTFRKALAEAADQPVQGRSIEDSRKMAAVVKRIWGGEGLTLSNEEAASIQKLAVHIYSPTVFDQLFCFLEGEDGEEEDKPKDP